MFFNYITIMQNFVNKKMSVILNEISWRFQNLQAVLTWVWLLTLQSSVPVGVSVQHQETETNLLA